MRHSLFSIFLMVCGLTSLQAHNQLTSETLVLKTPGNPSVSYVLDGKEKHIAGFPAEVRKKQVYVSPDVTRVEIRIRANQDIYYRIEQTLDTGFPHDSCLFYMPGFWYRKNLRSPESAPSFHTSDSWTVREDRLSAPLTGIYNESNGEYVTVLRTDTSGVESLACHSRGEVILSGETSVGFTGFANAEGNAVLAFGFPYKEEPKSYIRKLTLAPPVYAFEKMSRGEERSLVWEIRRGVSRGYSDFVADVWDWSYRHFRPEPVAGVRTQEEVKSVLAEYFRQSYVDEYPIKYYSGVGLRTADCLPNGKAEVGFVGRVLLNAFNALEYARSISDDEMAYDAESVFDSYLRHGFTAGGFFREDIDFAGNTETETYSIRRQSEGAYAVLLYLAYEKMNGREHPEWESVIRRLLDRFGSLQLEDGSMPRKFRDNLETVDVSGGSTSSAVLPLTMAYSYFGDRNYLKMAERAAGYLETHLIAESDYFSSTLDANCEDKEASLYTATAMYYMALAEKSPAKKRHYTSLCLEASYFALSWYYLWDVPFAQGQMLGDVSFKSRGWGNVSVENNHIDVFIFEFADVLDYLAEECGKPEFSRFTEVIRSSMLQLLPEKGSMFDIARVGYYPEVVQHTAWDYGKNGKGFYNDIFAPGWTVASLWQMLSPGRTENYFKNLR